MGKSYKIKFDYYLFFIVDYKQTLAKRKRTHTLYHLRKHTHTNMMLFLLSIIFNGKNRKNAPPYIGGYFPEPEERSFNEEFEFRYGTLDSLANDMLNRVYSSDECRKIFEEIFLLYKREQYPVQELLRRLVEDDRFTGELILYTNGYSLFYEQMWPSDTHNRIEEYWFHNMDQLVDNIFNGIFTDEAIQIIFKLSFIVYRYNDNRFLHALKNDSRLTRELISLGSSEVEEFFRNRFSYDDMSCCEDCRRIKIPLFMLDLFPDNDWNLRDFLHETLILTVKTAIKLQNAFPDRIVSSYLGDNDQELKMLCDLIYENHENSRFTEFFEGLNNLIDCGFDIKATTFNEIMEVIDTANSPLEITFLDGDTVELPVGWAYESLQELFQRVALQQGLDNPWLYFGERFVDPHMDFHIRQDLLNGGDRLVEVLMGAYYNSATFEDRVQYNPGCMEGIGQRFEEMTFKVHILELPCDCQIALQSCVSHFNY